MQWNELQKIKRFKDIISTLTKYGFDDFVQRLEIPGAAIIRKIHPVEIEMGLFERIRCAMEDLGPTFVKMGQIMSLRSDLLPPEFLDELSKLQDEVPPSETDDIKATIEENIEQSIEDVFSVFNVEPLAAASLSQIHQAVLKQEGKIVCIKVQRPGIREKIQSDMAILETFINFVHQKFDELKSYDLPGLIKVVRSHLMKEIDFSIEARNMRIARSNADEGSIYIPAVYQDYCSEKILVMDFVQGTKLKDAVFPAQKDARQTALQGLKAGIFQILEDGFFHADPHPGNILIVDDGRTAIIDWGMVGRLTETERFELIDLLKGIVDKDSGSILRSLLVMCKSIGKDMDERALERDILDVLDAYYAVPIKDMHIGRLLMSLSNLLRTHRLQLPTNLVIMIKALVTAEGSARLIYPDLDVVSETRSLVHRLALKRYKPEVVWRRISQAFSSILNLQRELPAQLRQIVSKLDKGKLEMRFQLDELEQLVNSLENASSRLTTGIITGAIIMGSSMIITTGIGPHIFGFPALGVIGYIMSVLLGIWLIITILRSKR